MNTPELGSFGKRWGFPEGTDWLEIALTHRSADPVRGRMAERLEFLGDAVVGAAVAKELFERLGVEMDEGALSRARVSVIRRETLANAARELGIDRLVEIGGNERRWRRNEQDRLLSDTYEAVVGALHCAAGASRAEEFVRASLGAAIDRAVREKPGPDPKTAFQERVQAAGGSTPVYRIVEHETDGVGHRYRVEALVGGMVVAEGVGPNRRAAERAAAVRALDDGSLAMDTEGAK